ARLRPGGLSNAVGAIVPIDIINEEVDAVRRSSGRLLKVTHDGGTGAVLIDAAAFRSVITHLCDNAVRASQDDIEIRVRQQQLRVEAGAVGGDLMGKPKLLIVEDDEALCRQYRWAFPEYEIFSAGTREAARLLAEREHPPVAIVDLGLPPDAEGVSEGLALLS